jgi:hypothetical protein
VKAAGRHAARQLSSRSAMPGLPPAPLSEPPRRGTPDAVVLPPTGLRLDRQMPFDKWLGIGQQLAAATSSSAWCLGDWLVYGETRFTGRYRSAIEQTSLEYKTLRNYAWVARKFPHARRRAGLSFGHHAEVAALPEPEQDYWLRKAESLGWSRNELRREVHSSLAERGEEPAGSDSAPEPAGDDHAWPEGADAGHPASVAKLHVEVTADQLAMIMEAASKARLTVATWAPSVLEQAARAALAAVSRGADADPEQTQSAA